MPRRRSSGSGKHLNSLRSSVADAQAVTDAAEDLEGTVIDLLEALDTGSWAQSVSGVKELATQARPLLPYIGGQQAELDPAQAEGSAPALDQWQSQWRQAPSDQVIP